MTVRTLASLKSRLAVGVRLLVVDHTNHQQWIGKVRTVTRVGSTVFWFRQDGRYEENRSEIPKARDLTWRDDDTFTVDGGWTTDGVTHKTWTLRFLPHEGE